MPKTIEAQGSCLCGAVKVHAAAAASEVEACHCSMCRNWGGGPFLSMNCGADVTFEGEEHIGRFDSSRWAERGFCSRCGTHLFYRLKANSHHALPVGLFDGVENLLFHEEIFIDEKPGFYDFANDTEKLTAAEVFAKHGAPVPAAPTADDAG